MGLAPKINKEVIHELVQYRSIVDFTKAFDKMND